MSPGPALLAAAALEAALARLLALDPDAAPRLAALDGHVAAVEFSGLGLTLYLLPGASAIQVVDRYAGVPDVLVRGSPASFALAARGTPVAASGVEIVGDPLLAKALRELFEGLQIDWEEPLAQLLGDVAAHQIGRVVREGFAWLRGARDSLAATAAEFLHEESRALPTAAAVEDFLAAVDRLREGADRLDARIARLERARRHPG